jgi:hypothetical protein
LKFQLFLHYYTDWKLKIRYQLVTFFNKIPMIELNFLFVIIHRNKNCVSLWYIPPLSNFTMLSNNYVWMDVRYKNQGTCNEEYENYKTVGELNRLCYNYVFCCSERCSAPLTNCCEYTTAFQSQVTFQMRISNALIMSWRIVGINHSKPSGKYMYQVL